MHLIWFLLIGLAAGWIASHITRGGGLGLVGDLVIGILGAVIGGYIFGVVGIPLGYGLLGRLVVSTVGAVILIFLLHLIKRV